MGEVRVSQTFGGSVHEAERCWYETERWHEWVDGFGSVLEVSGDWPGEGSQVVWQSVPAGRGRVRERVCEFTPLVGQTLAIEDDSVTGRQQVAFEAMADGVQVTLSLDYAITRRSPLTPLIDRLFVRRLMAQSLARTVDRFGIALADRDR